MLQSYVSLARRLGVPATARSDVGTDVVDAISGACEALVREIPRIAFFAGQLVFEKERWYHAILHNQTTFAVQKRLHEQQKALVILPCRI